MAKTSFTLTHGRASDFRGSSTDPARLVVNKAITLLAGADIGAYPACTAFSVDTGPASGTVTLAATADDVQVTVGGYTTAAVSAAGTDTLTAADVATEINGTAGMSTLVSATSSGAVVTITSLVNGEAGNFPLSAIAGAGTATASGAALTGGATTTYTF